MIKRYSRKQLTDIWSEENKYKIWLDVEIAAAEAMEKLGQIPRGVSSIVRKKAKINVSRIHKIESEVKHDVIAFLSSVTEKAGIKARYLHQGMTSSDVLDTSFNIQLVQSGKIILNDIDQILKVLKRQAKKYKLTACMGRSHGIHAEPITFGLKLASFYEEFKRNRNRLAYAINEVSTCAISGAVGTFANINPNIEKLYDTLIFIAAKTKNWNQIILLSDKAFSNKLISKNDLNENKSIGFYEIAKIKFDSDTKDALKNILKAVELKKNFAHIEKRDDNLDLLNFVSLNLYIRVFRSFLI